MAGLTPDVGAFLARLVRLDPAALVRVRAGDAGEHTALWGRVPWDVLVSRVRRKLSGTGRDAPIITVRGVGYMLNAEVTRR